MTSVDAPVPERAGRIRTVTAWFAVLALVTATAWWLWNESAIDLLDSAGYGDANEDLLEGGFCGWVTGPRNFFYQPLGHLVCFAGGGTVLVLVAAGLLGALSLALVFLHRRRGGAWRLCLALGAGTLAMATSPYALLLPVLAAPIGWARMPSWSDSPRYAGFALLAVPAVLFSMRLADLSLESPEATWRQAGGEPLAEVFLGQAEAGKNGLKVRQEARQRLQQALPLLPPSTLKLSGLETLVELQFQSGARQQAAESAELAAEVADRLPARQADDEHRVKAYLLAARCLFADGFDKKALEWIGRVKRLDAEHPDVLAYEAELLLNDTLDLSSHRVDPKHANNQRADQMLARSLERDPNCYRARVASGRWAQARGRLLQARKQYRSAVEARPTDPEPFVLLVNLYLQNDMLADADRAVNEALGRKIDDPRLHYSRGVIYFMQGKREEAQRYFEAVLQYQPDNVDVRRMLAKVIASSAIIGLEQLTPKALTDMANRIRELDPHCPQGLVVSAAVLKHNRKHRDAIVMLEQAQEKLKDDHVVRRRLADAYRDRGFQLMFQNKKELAMDHFRKFLGVAPGTGLPTTNVQGILTRHCMALEENATAGLKGKARLQSKDFEAAEALYRRSGELLPERSASFHYRAVSRLMQKDFAEALRLSQQAENIAKRRGRSFGVYRMMQVEVLQHMKKPDEARLLAEDFLKEPGKESKQVVDAIRKLIQD